MTKLRAWGRWQKKGKSEQAGKNSMYKQHEREKIIYEQARVPEGST